MKQQILGILFLIVLIGVLVFLIKEGTRENVSKPLETSQKSEQPKVEQNSAEQNIKEATMSARSYQSPPAMQINISKGYKALMETTKGVMTIELFTKETPVTVNNFVFLARDGFYEGTVFHRIIKGFMVQGGDPNGDGTGGPGYKFADEKVTKDYKRGIIAMANSGPNTNGSQFFIMHKDNNLSKNYVIFGQVVEGTDVLDKIAEVSVVDNPSMPGEKSKPMEKVTVNKITIEER